MRRRELLGRDIYGLQEAENPSLAGGALPPGLPRGRTAKGRLGYLPASVPSSHPDPPPGECVDAGVAAVDIGVVVKAITFPGRFSEPAGLLKMNPPAASPGILRRPRYRDFDRMFDCDEKCFILFPVHRVLPVPVSFCASRSTSTFPVGIFRGYSHDPFPRTSSIRRTLPTRGETCPATKTLLPLDATRMCLHTITQIQMGGGEEVQTRLNANVEEELAKRLKHVLVDEGISFSEWLRRQIDQYLAGKEPKGKRDKGKEA
jgi:hypothetical protein